MVHRGRTLAKGTASRFTSGGLGSMPTPWSLLDRGDPRSQALRKAFCRRCLEGLHGVPLPGPGSRCFFPPASLSFNIRPDMRRLALLLAALFSAALPAQKPVWESPRLDENVLGHSAPMNVPLAGAKEIWLVLTDAGDGYGADHGNWMTPTPSLQGRHHEETRRSRLEDRHDRLGSGSQEQEHERRSSQGGRQGRRPRNRDPRQQPHPFSTPPRRPQAHGPGRNRQRRLRPERFLDDEVCGLHGEPRPGHGAKGRPGTRHQRPRRRPASFPRPPRRRRGPAFREGTPASLPERHRHRPPRPRPGSARSSTTDATRASAPRATASSSSTTPTRTASPTR